MANDMGNRYSTVYTFYIIVPKCKDFDSIEDAKKQIEDWKKEPTYHYV